MSAPTSNPTGIPEDVRQLTAPLTRACQPNLYHPWYAIAMTHTEAPAARTLASTVTVTRSSHPEFTYLTVTEAFIDGTPMGRKVRHDHTAAQVDAHLIAIRSSAARLGVALTINDNRDSF